MSKTPNPRFSARSGSTPISELGPRVRCTMTISPENAAWLDAQDGKRSAVVNRLLDAARKRSDSGRL